MPSLVVLGSSIVNCISYLFNVHGIVYLLFPRSGLIIWRSGLDYMTCFVRLGASVSGLGLADPAQEVFSRFSGPGVRAGVPPQRQVRVGGTAGAVGVTHTCRVILYIYAVHERRRRFLYAKYLFHVCVYRYGFYQF